MVRPKKMRLVTEYPLMSGYLPENMEPTGTVDLSVEGIEAIRLSDLDGLAHEAAAEQMGISRQTYGRVLAEARKIIAEALITGKRICFGGGMYTLHGGLRRRHQRGQKAHQENCQAIVQNTLERLNGENSTGGHIMPEQPEGGPNTTGPKDGKQDQQNSKNTNQGCNTGKGLGRGGGQGRRDGSGGGKGRGGGGKGGRRNQS